VTLIHLTIKSAGLHRAELDPSEMSETELAQASGILYGALADQSRRAKDESR
jgi:hypothetical protein